MKGSSSGINTAISLDTGQLYLPSCSPVDGLGLATKTKEHWLASNVDGIRCHTVCLYTVVIVIVSDPGVLLYMPNLSIQSNRIVCVRSLGHNFSISLCKIIKHRILNLVVMEQKLKILLSRVYYDIKYLLS